MIEAFPGGSLKCFLERAGRPVPALFYSLKANRPCHTIYQENNEKTITKLFYHQKTGSSVITGDLEQVKSFFQAGYGDHAVSKDIIKLFYQLS